MFSSMRLLIVLFSVVIIFSCGSDNEIQCNSSRKEGKEKCTLRLTRELQKIPKALNSRRKDYPAKKTDDQAYALGHPNHKYDFYEPIGKEESSPLIIFIHGGAFLTGHKESHVITKLCTDFTRIGYRTASINYRLIDLPNNWESAWSAVNLTSYSKKKIYNALQDISAAIRYFKANAEELKVDPNNIYIAGYSAGAIAALHLTFSDQAECNSYFGAESEGGLDALQVYVGDGNARDHKVKGVISISGALFDKAHIDDQENPPLLLIHGDADQMVPYDIDRPFQKFVKDYEFEMPGLYYEFGITKNKKGPQGEETTEYRIGGLEVSYKIPRWLPKLFVDYLTPEMFGSRQIYKHVYDNCQFVQIKKGNHSFMMNDKGDFNKSYQLIRERIEDFIVLHSGKNRRSRRERN